MMESVRELGLWLVCSVLRRGDRKAGAEKDRLARTPPGSGRPGRSRVAGGCRPAAPGPRGRL
jgi:hypothetical protein